MKTKSPYGAVLQLILLVWGDYVNPQLQNKDYGIVMQHRVHRHIFRPVKELLANIFQDGAVGRHFRNSWSPRLS